MIYARFKKKSLRVTLYVVLIIIGLSFLFPFIWMLLSSFKSQDEVLAIPIKFFPTEWSFKSYITAWEWPAANFPRYYLNSIIILICATAGAVVLSTLAGYGFAKFKFRGNNFFFIIILATWMIPFQAVVVPLFLWVTKMGLNDRYLGLIIPLMLNAFGVFLMRQFMYSIPDEIIESARIDGAGEFRIFFSIAVPMVKTPILSLVVIHGLAVWNNLLWPLVITNSGNMRTVPQGLALFTGLNVVSYPERLAASTTACIPILLLYLVLSKYFIRGFTLSGLKG